MTTIHTPTIMLVTHGGNVILNIWNPNQVPRKGEQITVSKRVYHVDNVNYDYSTREITITIFVSFRFMEQ